MSGQNGGKKLTFEDKKTKADVPATTDGNGQNNQGDNGEKLRFREHPIKWVKSKFEEHPVGATVVTVGGIGVLGFIGKCVVDALGGGESEDSEELDDCEDYDEDEDDEEDEEE